MLVVSRLLIITSEIACSVTLSRLAWWHTTSEVEAKPRRHAFGEKYTEIAIRGVRHAHHLGHSYATTIGFLAL